MSQNEITAKVREIKELQRIMDEAAAEIEALKDAPELYAKYTKETISCRFTIA